MYTVIVTGANRGIGFELVRQYLSLGCEVIATYRHLGAATQLINLASNDLLTVHQLDVASQEQIQLLTKDLQGKKIDLLINNAGVNGEPNQSFESLDLNNWLNTFTVNTYAPLFLSHSLLENLKLAKQAKIVSVSSMMGSLTHNLFGSYAYSGSKAALTKIMQILALELSPQNITVCSIDPGWVKTDMGGVEAELSVEESVTSIINTISNLTLSDSGHFVSRDGERADQLIPD